MDLPARFPSGADILLSAGEFVVSRPVLLPPRTRVRGDGREKTTIRLAPRSNCHAILGEGERQNPLTNVWLEGFRIAGEAAHQSRPAGGPLAFSCGIYLREVRSVLCLNLAFEDIRQTGVHFSSCTEIAARRIQARSVGWSGVSAADSTNVWIEAEIADAGRDVMHSGIHIDGGMGVLIDATVRDTTGNGIMLDSTFAPLRQCLVRGKASGCRRGVSLSGSAMKPLETVAISGRYFENREAGVMVSNASGVTIFHAEIRNNKGPGILAQGRNGGRQILVADDVVLEGNNPDFSQQHASGANWVFINPFDSPPIAS
jgi:hypothetical protein